MIGSLRTRSFHPSVHRRIPNLRRRSADRRTIAGQNSSVREAPSRIAARNSSGCAATSRIAARNNSGCAAMSTTAEQNSSEHEATSTTAERNSSVREAPSRIAERNSSGRAATSTTAERNSSDRAALSSSALRTGYTMGRSGSPANGRPRHNSAMLAGRTLCSHDCPIGIRSHRIARILARPMFPRMIPGYRCRSVATGPKSLIEIRWRRSGWNRIALHCAVRHWPARRH